MDMGGMEQRRVELIDRWVYRLLSLHVAAIAPAVMVLAMIGIALLLLLAVSLAGLAFALL